MPESRRRYGLRQDSVGSRLYHHDSGAIVLRTGGWEGVRSGDLRRWEIGHLESDGTPTVGDDGRLFRTLREAAGALDAEAILREQRDV